MNWISIVIKLFCIPRILFAYKSIDFNKFKFFTAKFSNLLNNYEKYANFYWFLIYFHIFRSSLSISKQFYKVTVPTAWGVNYFSKN